MRSRKSTYIMYAMLLGTLLLTLFICGKQIMDVTESIAEKQNDRYAEIEKALGR